jgi:hypothetical protein
MWSEPHLEPVYSAVRSYLEIEQRVGLLTERLDVIAGKCSFGPVARVEILTSTDLLAVLREQGSRRHGEVLEWIGKRLDRLIRLSNANQWQSSFSLQLRFSLRKLAAHPYPEQGVLTLSQGDQHRRRLICTANSPPILLVLFTNCW